jgi:hypothetical protein
LPPAPEFCPVAPGAKVRIVTTMQREIEWTAWLCADGVERLKASDSRIVIRKIQAPPHADLPCEHHGPLGQACP